MKGNKIKKRKIKENKIKKKKSALSYALLLS